MSGNKGKDYSASQERDIARLLGGRVQSNSGGTRFGGGDVHTNQFFIEAKTPAKAQTSFSIKLDWISKMLEQAFQQGKYHSALAFRFAPDGQDYFVISSSLMKQLVEHIEAQEDK